MQSFKILAAILGIFSFIFAILVQFFLPELPEAVTYLLILGAILVLYYVVFSLNQIRFFLLGKRGRYGINSAIMILVFLGILLLANYLGLLKHKRFDVTSSGKFTLAPQTINTLKNLKSPVEVIAFFPEMSQFRPQRERVQYLLEEYRFHNKNFSFRFIDPETKPAVTRKFNVRQNGTIVFISGERQKPVTMVTEQVFTGAILEVLGIKSKKIYFLSGHGEKSIHDSGGKGYSFVRMGLIRDLYQVEPLNLTQNKVVPSDCAVLVIPGASKSLPHEEREAIRQYMKDYGKLLLLTDPNPPIEIQQILADWGIRIQEGRVLDGRAYAVPDKRTPAVYRGNYPPMIITRNLDTTYYPEATTIDLTRELARVVKADRTKKEREQAQKPQGQAQPLGPGWPLDAVQHENLVLLPTLLTTNMSWMEQISDAPAEASEEDVETENKEEGPLVIGAMLLASANLIGEKASKPSEGKLTRIIAIGDSDFASNAHIRNGGNGDLFLNAVSWLAEEERLIDIRPKQYSFRRLVISQNATRFIRFSSLALLPLLVLILGGAIWWKNR